MDIIVKPNSFFSQIWKEQQYDPDVTYRRAKHCHAIKHGDVILIYNFLTRMFVSCAADSFEDAVNKNKEFFVKNYFLVPEDFNEIELADFLARAVNASRPVGKPHGFVIFTTTVCNARCPYCFEKNSPVRHMTEQTANDIGDFILNTIDPKKPVSFTWFGGEPLMNPKVIDIICGKLRDDGVSFSSYVISNGYLFDNDMVEHALKYWNLKKAQITLDGTEDVYNRIKAYVYKNDESPFKRVTSNIQKLVDHNVKVGIRLNVSEENCENLEELVRQLAPQFSGNDLVRVYCHDVYHGNEHHPSKEDLELSVLRSRVTFKIVELIEQLYHYNHALLTPEIRGRRCMADRDDCVTLLPDGTIIECESYLEDEPVGTIYDDYRNQDVIRRWKESGKNEACKDCVLYAKCDAIKNCPNHNPDICFAGYRNTLLYKSELQMISTYEDYIKNKKTE